MKRIVLILALLVFSLAFLSGDVYGDVYIKSSTHSEAFEIMGQKQPEKNQVTEQWIGKGKFANVLEGQTMVLDLTQKMMYVIYPAEKTFVKAELPLDISKLIPEEMLPMLQMMKMTVTVNPTGETKKIGDWNCNGYEAKLSMMMMQMEMKIWATKDVPFDWQTYSDQVMAQVMKTQMVGMDEKAMDEFKKIKGFQVVNDMKMMMMGQEVKVTNKVMEITEKTAPAGIYSVPQGFKEQQKLNVKQGM